MTYDEALAVRCGADQIDGVLVVGQVVTTAAVHLTLEGGREITAEKEN